MVWYAILGTNLVGLGLLMEGAVARVPRRLRRFRVAVWVCFGVALAASVALLGRRLREAHQALVDAVSGAPELVGSGCVFESRITLHDAIFTLVSRAPLASLFIVVPLTACLVIGRRLQRYAEPIVEFSRFEEIDDEPE